MPHKPWLRNTDYEMGHKNTKTEYIGFVPVNPWYGTSTSTTEADTPKETTNDEINASNLSKMAKEVLREDAETVDMFVGRIMPGMLEKCKRTAENGEFETCFVVLKKSLKKNNESYMNRTIVEMEKIFNSLGFQTRVTCGQKGLHFPHSCKCKEKRIIVKWELAADTKKEVQCF